MIALKIAVKALSLVAATACVVSLASCSLKKPVEEYSETVNYKDLITTNETTTQEKNYKKGWPAIVLEYIAPYFGEGKYVKTASKKLVDSTLYVLLFDDVPLEDALSYGRSVGIWEDDWTKELDDSYIVTDKHKKFVISLNYTPNSFNGYNFKISIRILH